MESDCHGLGQKGCLYQVPSSKKLNKMSTSDRATWEDVISRSILAASLILDEKPGMLDSMVASTSNGPQPEFGEEILELARRLQGK